MVAVQVAFASIATSGKLALNGGLPPLALAGLRILGAALVLAILFVLGRRRRPAARDLPVLFGLALLGIGLNQTLFLVGLSHTTAVNANVLITMIPVFTLVVAVAFGRERFDAVRAFGVAVALAGALVLLRVEDFRLDDGVVVGNLLIVLNAFLYSFYLVFVDGMIRKYGSLSVITWVFLLAAPVIVPIGMPSLAGALGAGSVTSTAWWALAWVIAVPTVIAYGGTVFVRKHLSASTVGASVFLQPLAGIALALALLPEETLTPRAIVAGALILVGVAFVWVRERAPRRPEPVSP